MNFAFSEFVIRSNGSLCQFHKVGTLERFENIYLAAGEEWSDNFERWIFGCSANKRNSTILNCTKQRILLRFAETVYFVDKKNWIASLRIKKTALFGFFNYFPNVFYTRSDCTKGVKRAFKSVGNNFCQCSFTYTGRPPQYERSNVPRLYHLSEYGLRAYQMFLTDVFIERLGAKSFSEWLHILA